MRKPSRTASFTSDTVTSFWKSTKALPRLPSTCHTGLATALSSAAARGLVAGAAKPHSEAALAPSSSPSARQAARPNVPLAAPATLMPGGMVPGTSAARPSFHCGLPLRWVVRWSVGFQPPDMAMRSQATLSRPPFASLIVTPLTPRRPRTRSITAPAKIARLRRLGRLLRGVVTGSAAHRPRPPPRFRHGPGRTPCERRRHCRRRRRRGGPAPRRSD